MSDTRRALQSECLRLTWSEHAEHDCLRVLGWSPAAREALARLDSAALAARFAVVPASLMAVATGVEALQGIAGRFERDGDALCFFPRWPFVEGLEYALIERSPSNEYETVATLRRPAAELTPTVEVLGIYPSAPVVPLNLLKIYISFSAPMSEGCAARAVHVRRADSGEALGNVFLPNSLELWDPARTRLTLLLDPGRIKRGLLPHQQLGYPLTAGVPITVAVDSQFLDAHGQPLRVPAERRYEVVPAIRTRVDPACWQVDVPAAATHEPLSVTFDRPLDRALLDHALTLDDREGRAIPGRAIVTSSEGAWQFAPDAEWAAGNYTLTIDNRLEDLAGNSVTRVFDRDLRRAEDTPRRGGSADLHFTVE